MSDTEPLHEWLKLASDAAARHAAGIRDLRITPDVSAAEIRRHLAANYDFARPIAAEALVAGVGEMLREWNLHVTHPRYFGLFNPSVQPASVAADTLVAAFNPQIAAWSHAPASAEIERHTLRFFAARLGLDPDATSACFTTGGAEANQSGVLAALTHLLPDYARKGLAATTRPPRMYVSSESHHSLEKIAHGSGIGREAVRYVPVDDALRLDVGALSRMIEEDRAAGTLPLLVVATAGTTGGGIIDPLPRIADLCREHRLWMHVDAAWGGAACLSPTLRSCLDGIERADSITWDAHKWLSVPMGAGMFFCAHPGAVRATFEIATPYMPKRPDDAVDPYVSTIQWSRRNIGLKVFMSLAALGAEGYRELIEHQARMGDELRAALVGGGWRVVNDTPLPVVCFTHPRIEEGATSARAVVAGLIEKNFWVSEVRLGGAAPVVRACITSYLTQMDDVQALALEANEVLKRRM